MFVFGHFRTRARPPLPRLFFDMKIKSFRGRARRGSMGAWRRCRRGWFAATVRFTAEQAQALRSQVIAQRAARTFSVERGRYEIERREVGREPPNGVDVRGIIYMGAQTCLSNERLTLDLRQLGARFVLKLEEADHLASYGYTKAEQPIIDALYSGTSLPELDAMHREIDPRTAQALIYALA